MNLSKSLVSLKNVWVATVCISVLGASYSTSGVNLTKVYYITVYDHVSETVNLFYV